MDNDYGVRVEIYDGDKLLLAKWIGLAIPRVGDEILIAEKPYGVKSVQWRATGELVRVWTYGPLR